MAGTLVIIGGHEDREGEKTILREIADRVGGRRVVVVMACSLSAVPRAPLPAVPGDPFPTHGPGE